MRPPPPVLEVAETELIWLNPDYAPKLQWDTAMCQVQLSLSLHISSQSTLFLP